MRMKRRLLFIFLSVCIFLICTASFSFAGTSTGTVYVNTTQNYKNAQQVLKLVNKERSKRGLKELKMDRTLTNAAIQRAAELGVYIPQSSPHRRPDGRLASTVVSGAIGENCAEGQTTPKEVVNDWMDSDVHRKMILLKSAKSVGIACVTTSGEDHNWVMVFSNKSAKNVEKNSKTKVVSSKKVVAKSSYLKKSYFSLRVNKKLAVGKKQTIKAEYIGPYSMEFFFTGISPKSFTWKSSNKKVLTVNSKGVVTGKKKGSATVTATLKKGPKVTLKYKITVSDVSKPALNHDSIDLVYGESYRLIVKNPGKTVKWQSADDSIATVSDNGTVSWRGKGNTVITAVTNGQTLSCKVYCGDVTENAVNQLIDYIVTNTAPASDGSHGYYIIKNQVHDASGTIFHREYTMVVTPKKDSVHFRAVFWDEDDEESDVLKETIALQIWAKPRTKKNLYYVNIYTPDKSKPDVYNKYQLNSYTSGARLPEELEERMLTWTLNGDAQTKPTAKQIADAYSYFTRDALYTWDGLAYRNCNVRLRDLGVNTTLK